MSGEILDDAEAIPEGEYPLRYLDYRTTIAFTVPKVAVRFEIAAGTERAGVVVERWYRVARLRGPQKKYGDFVVGTRSDLYRELSSLYGQIDRADRISFTGLNRKVVIGRIGYVQRDSAGKTLPAGSEYSVVRELLRFDDSNSS